LGIFARVAGGVGRAVAWRNTNEFFVLAHRVWIASF